MKARRAAAHALALAALAAAWEALARSGAVSEFHVGRPAAVAAALARDLRDPAFAAHALASVRNLAAGYALGLAAGAALGVLLGGRRRLYDHVGPYARVLSTVPQLVLIPFFILWFGIEDAAKIAIVALMTFFPVLIASMEAASRAPRDLADVCAAYGAGPLVTLACLILPASAEGVFTGAKVAVSRAVAGLILGETFGRAQGLGYLLFRYGNEYSANDMLAVLLVIAALTFALFRLIALAERRLVTWRR